jgi:hypothetical protein
MFNRIKSSRLRFLPLVLVIPIMLTACAQGSSSAYQRNEAKITAQYAAKLDAAVPYPLAQMNDSEERRNIRERLLRFNNPEKVGYVYLLGMNGNYVGYYVVKGKVSSTGSMMTVTQQMTESCTRNHCYGAPTESMGDDGSYGPNEGGNSGIFFFTASGVMVETQDPFWIYEDAPLSVNAPKLNPTSGPTTTSKFWRK